MICITLLSGIGKMNFHKVFKYFLCWIFEIFGPSECQYCYLDRFIDFGEYQVTLEFLEILCFFHLVLYNFWCQDF